MPKSNEVTVGALYPWQMAIRLLILPSNVM